MDDGEEREPATEPLVGAEEEQTDEAFVEGYDPFCEVRGLLEREDITGAQARLDRFEEKSAEWHYLQAVIYRKRNWFTESYKSLETAIELDP